MAAGAQAELARSVRRTIAWTLLLAVVLGAGAGWVGKRRDEWFSASTTLLVNPLLGNPFSPEGGDSLVNMETERRLVVSDPVARRVSQTLRHVTPEEALSGVTVEVPPNTQVVSITVRDRSTAGARYRAEAFGTAYLAYRTSRQHTVQAGRAAELEDQVRSLRGELKRLTTQYGQSSTNSPRRVLLGQQVADATAQLGQLRTELSGLRTGSQDPGQVVTPAAADPRPPVPFALIGAVGGVLVALLLGAVVLVVRVRGGGRVGTVADLVAAGHDPLRGDGETLRARVLTAVRDSSDAAPGTDSGAGPLAVLVGGVGVDPAPLAEELACALARAGANTVLVDLSPAADPGPDGEVQRGIAEILGGGLQLARAWEPGHEGVRVLRTGALAPADLGDTVASTGFEALVRRAAEGAEVVVVTGVELAGPTGELLMGRADLVLPVVTRALTRISDLDEVVLRADALGVRVGGVVWWRPSRRRTRAAKAAARQVPAEPAPDASDSAPEASDPAAPASDPADRGTAGDQRATKQSNNRRGAGAPAQQEPVPVRPERQNGSAPGRGRPRPQRGRGGKSAR